MDEIKTKKQKDEKVPTMTEKEALDILLQHVAKGKQDVAAGRVLTIEQSIALINQKANQKK